MKFAWHCFAALLFCSPCVFAQTNTAVFQPNTKITLIVRFEKKLVPGSEVQVQFRRKSGSSEECNSDQRINWSGTSQDNQMFEMSSTIPENIASGTYGFSSLTLSSPGFAPGVSNQPVDLTFQTENHRPCPKHVEVPKFDISIKP
jgi:plastocyanin domain-containing protein